MNSSIQFPEKLRGLFEPYRYKVFYGGRGGAKSWGFARALLIQGASRPLRILCAREIQKSIKDSVHQLLKDQIAAMGLEGFYTALETEILGKNGTQFAFAGLRQQNVTSLKSFEGCDICWVEEAHTVTKRSWGILIPTIRKEGSEIWVSFNPELDTDDTYTRFVVDTPPNTLLTKIGIDDNPFASQTLLDEMEHSRRTDPEAFRNIWLGEPVTVVAGAIYKHEIPKVIEEKRLRPVPYDPMLKVHTIWDLGWNDSMVVIFAQVLRGEVRIIDYIEDSHRTMSDYVAEIERKRYRWGTDFLPHDGAAKDFKSGKSAEEIMRDLGRYPEVLPNLDVEQGIRAARLMFPRVYFDETKARPLFERLKRYKRRIHMTTDEPMAPEHDEASHGADAFRYLAMAVDRMGNESPKPIQYSNRGIV